MSTVIVLCGGMGERLMSVVDDRPKVLADVGGKPFLSYVLDRLERDGATEILLSTGYAAEMVEDFVRGRAVSKVPIRCVAEPEPLGTAGAIHHVAGNADIDRAFFVLNGDTWFDGSLARLDAFHAERAAALSLALVEVADGSRYGQVVFDADDGRVRSFIEKSDGGGPGWINAGLYRLEPSVLDLVPSGQFCSLEREVFPQLVGHGLYAQSYEDASFLDIGTPDDFHRAHELFDDGQGSTDGGGEQG
jgi:D-glycero-alpha-D-manno-heptose 1-phosphate guanylyltransferase